MLTSAADAVRHALDGMAAGDWRRPGQRAGQYHLDLVADEAALSVLHSAGLAVFSEESGLTVPADTVPSSDDANGLLVVVDPVDGSTNASHGIPWFATSLCVVDGDGPLIALVVNQALGVRYTARRGGGAAKDGRPIAPSGLSDVARAMIGVSGLPRRRSAWWQTRALGAAALDLCLVAEGVLDGFVVGARSTLHVWDYLGALLVCQEAGAVVVDADGDDLVVRSAAPRRPIGAATVALTEELLADAAIDSGGTEARLTA